MFSFRGKIISFNKNEKDKIINEKIVHSDRYFFVYHMAKVNETF